MFSKRVHVNIKWNCSNNLHIFMCFFKIPLGCDVNISRKPIVQIAAVELHFYAIANVIRMLSGMFRKHVN